MSDASSKPAFPFANLSNVEEAYGHWVGIAVETFNSKGEVKPCLLSLNFLQDGSFDCTFIDAAYVAQMVATEEGQLELRKFTTGLLDDEKMRADMASKGFKPADAVVFITEIEMMPANGSTESRMEGILVAVHIPGAIYRGVSQIHSKPTRHAVVGPMSLDSAPRTVSSALSPLPSSVVAEVLATRMNHDIHRTPRKTQ